jgi:hypothetical protein
MKRLFSHNKQTGMTRWFHFDELTEQVTITTEQEVDDVLDDSKRAFNQYGKGARWGDGDKVANIPMGVYSQWCAKGQLGDEAVVRAWLNDPANKHFRTRPGRV